MKQKEITYSCYARADPINKFWSKFNDAFSKLDRFSAVRKIVHNNETD